MAASEDSIPFIQFCRREPYLIHDLLRRLKKNPNIPPIYMVEVFTKSGVDAEAAKQYIFEKTGMVPAIYDKGTHYVTNQKLTLEILKEISESAAAVRLVASLPSIRWSPTYKGRFLPSLLRT